MTKQKEQLKDVEALITARGLEKTIETYILGLMDENSRRHFEKVMQESAYLRAEVSQLQAAVCVEDELNEEILDESDPTVASHHADTVGFMDWSAMRKAAGVAQSLIQSFVLSELVSTAAASIVTSESIEAKVQWNGQLPEQDLSVYYDKKVGLVLKWNFNVFRFPPVTVVLERGGEEFGKHTIETGNPSGVQVLIKNNKELLDLIQAEKPPSRIIVRTTEA